LADMDLCASLSQLDDGNEVNSRDQPNQYREKCEIFGTLLFVFVTQRHCCCLCVDA
jgi:hypothetical protein